MASGRILYTTNRMGLVISLHTTVLVLSSCLVKRRNRCRCSILVFGWYFSYVQSFTKQAKSVHSVLVSSMLEVPVYGLTVTSEVSYGSRCYHIWNAG